MSFRARSTERFAWRAEKRKTRWGNRRGPPKSPEFRRDTDGCPPWLGKLDRTPEAIEIKAGLRRDFRPADSDHPILIRLPSEAACWQTVLERCTAADPPQRFSRPKDVAEALQHALPGTRANPTRRFRVTVIAVLTVAALFTGMMWLRRGPAIEFKERDWGLISRFENRTGEGILDGVMEYELQAELSNSR